MMSIIESLFYFCCFVGLNFAMAMFVAIAFFGATVKEVTEEEYNDLLKHRGD